MDSILQKMLDGYHRFKEKYVLNDSAVMQQLAINGQKPQIMVIACCDSRVDPALILQCDPGDLFIVRNVANIVPPYEKDEMHHGTSAALEFAIQFLKIKHLILLGHSQCGGIQTLLNNQQTPNDFITNWVSLVNNDNSDSNVSCDEYAKLALRQSYKNCLTFPWIKEKVDNKELTINLWFFEIEKGQILTSNPEKIDFQLLK